RDSALHEVEEIPLVGQYPPVSFVINVLGHGASFTIIIIRNAGRDCNMLRALAAIELRFGI
ncbi:MAG: hypothetical protein LBP73_07915, partial [Clostridiales Family XIII bacterium]|nr:hypothetical protein [Clostridiales Family XIII bacterium]